MTEIDPKMSWSSNATHNQNLFSKMTLEEKSVASHVIYHIINCSKFVYNINS